MRFRNRWAALLLVLRHAYTLVNVALGIPALIKYGGGVMVYINTGITVGIVVGVILLLALAINKIKTATEIII